MRLRRVLSAVGAGLTGAGVLILLFVAYQLWGTGLYTARAQGSLKDDFRHRIEVPAAAGSNPVPVATTTTTAAGPPPPGGEAVAIMRIPDIGVEHAVVEGVSPADLRKGPGHYPSTPMPGEAGNAAIAGHRTTYGAPFNRLDELDPGDAIEVTTVRGSYTYRVQEKLVVGPEQVEVLDPSPDARLTLTTCEPKYSAARRLIVVAGFEPGPAAVPPSPPPAAPEESARAAGDRRNFADAGLASDHSKVPAVLWGLVTVAVGLIWWWAVRRRRHWTTYVLGVVPFLVVLFVFYARLEVLLPSNF